jgi:glutamine amidotransferase
MRQAGVRDALRFTATLTDGHDLYAARWASDSKPPSLYLRQQDRGIIVASEPIDEARDCWQALGPGSVFIALAGRPPRISPIKIDEPAMA